MIAGIDSGSAIICRSSARLRSEPAPAYIAAYSPKPSVK